LPRAPRRSDGSIDLSLAGDIAAGPAPGILADRFSQGAGRRLLMLDTARSKSGWGAKETDRTARLIVFDTSTRRCWSHRGCAIPVCNLPRPLRMRLQATLVVAIVTLPIALRSPTWRLTIAMLMFGLYLNVAVVNPPISIRAAQSLPEEIHFETRPNALSPRRPVVTRGNVAAHGITWRISSTRQPS
jgi:hypothetical protein